MSCKGRRAVAATTGASKNGVPETRSIVSNAAMLRTAALSTLFAMACLAVPTCMAVLKQWGWW